MGGTKPDNLYLSYNEYHDMEKSFYSVQNYSYREDIYNTFVNSLNIPSKASEFKKVILLLIKYLSGSPAFMSYGNDHCCKYINYKLNKELKDIFYEVNDSMFKTFQDFVQKHDDEKGTKTCTSKLHYLDSTIVYQLQHLYDLYDKLKYIRTLNNNEPFCSKLTDIIRKYNLNIDEYYDNDKNYFNKLLNFKELVGKLKFPANSTCQEKITEFKTPAKYISDQEELSRPKKQEQELKEQSQHVPSVSLPTTESESLVAGNLEKVESEISEGQQFIAPPGQTQDLTVLKHERRLEDKKETRYFRPAEVTDDLVTHESSTFSGEPSHQTGYVRDTYILGNPTNDGEGIMKSLQSTFSNIVQNVDPAPVLGVSGGMGVLFILFKYTPVGSFFGGRRGRFHQIPSSFRGFPPGDFANFQEYDGGFIGYSPMNISPLAE